MLKYLTLFLFLGMIVMNYLANSIPLNRKTTGELSDSFPNLFVPAGITFSIWGIIYLLLAAYCIVQLNTENHLIVSKIGWFFAVSCVLNALWIVFWHYGKLPLSLIVMLGILVLLILVNIHIKALPIGIIKAAFGVYLGWICIATIANVTALLVHYKWTGMGISEEYWTIIMIAVGTIIASLSIYRMNNPFIGLSVIWAFGGIILKRHVDYRSIVFASVIAILVVGLFTLGVFFKKSLVGIF
jgi:hypothetical protein